MPEPLSVAVIGAGIAGVACAATLRDRGLRVSVFDKSRGIGGRMATRRVPPWQWDHGMQYMVGDDPEFQRLLQSLPTWANASAEPWYVGKPSQNQLVKDLARGIDLSLQTRVVNVAQNEDNRWVVEAEDSALGLPYDAIAIATPAPQARGAECPPLFRSGVEFLLSMLRTMEVLVEDAGHPWYGDCVPFDQSPGFGDALLGGDEELDARTSTSQNSSVNAARSRIEGMSLPFLHPDRAIKALSL